jgi:hypothetical protein
LEALAAAFLGAIAAGDARPRHGQRACRKPKLPEIEATGLLGQEDCGLWHRIAGDKKRFIRSRVPHSDQRDERRVLLSRKKSRRKFSQIDFFFSKHTQKRFP